MLLLVPAVGAEVAVEAARNVRLASEAFRRSHRTMKAWLERMDPVTGLLPRSGPEAMRRPNDANWVVKDTAADLYPFMVLAAYFTEPPLYETAMRTILRQEVLLSTRVGRLSDDLLPGGKGFAYPNIDLDRIIFGSSEYAKDGLLPITELLGETPWYHRMLGIATDLVRSAPYRSPRGPLPALGAEVNGNVLQLLSRLAWKTGSTDYLNQAAAIAEFYFLDMLPETNYLPADAWDLERRKPLRPVFVTCDHGNEIVGGLSEVYFLLKHKRPELARRFEPAFTRMIDRLLEVGRDADGLWVSRVELATGKPMEGVVCTSWGYMFNAVYTAYLATGDGKYKQAVERAIGSVTRKPVYLFDETGSGYNWGSDSYADSIESALVLLNRLPNSRTDEAIDAAMRKFFDRQKPSGIVEDWHGDGNFIRTALMYAFRKSQGAYVQPWNERVHVGAAREAGRLLVHVSSELPWKGRVHFDHPRHRDHFGITFNYPRLNEWPEWFTVEHDHVYTVQINEGPPRRYLGADLVSGIALSLEAGEIAIIKAGEAETPSAGGGKLK